MVLLDHAIHAVRRLLEDFVKNFEDSTGRLLVNFEDSTGRLARQVQGQAEVVVRGAGLEARDSIHHLAHHAQLVMTQVPDTARLTGRGFVDGVLSALFGTLPSLVSELEQLSERPLWSSVNLIARQPKPLEADKIRAYRSIFRKCGRKDLPEKDAFYQQLYVYEAALKDLGPKAGQGCFGHFFGWGLFADLQKAFIKFSDRNLALRALDYIKLPMNRKNPGELCEIFCSLAGTVTMELIEHIVQANFAAGIDAEALAGTMRKVKNDHQLFSMIRPMIELHESTASGERRQVSNQVMKAFASKIAGTAKEFPDLFEPKEDLVKLVIYWGENFTTECVDHRFDVRCTRDYFRQLCANGKYDEVVKCWAKFLTHPQYGIIEPWSLPDMKMEDQEHALPLALAAQEAGYAALVEQFPKIVQDVVTGSKKFVLDCKGEVLNGMGEDWTGGPGYWVCTTEKKAEDAEDSEKWILKPHEGGKYWSLSTKEKRLLDGDEKDWSNGPSFWCGTHPERDHPQKDGEKWMLIPHTDEETKKETMRLLCKVDHRPLNARGCLGRDWTHNPDDDYYFVTTEAQPRSGEELNWSFTQVD